MKEQFVKIITGKDVDEMEKNCEEFINRMATQDDTFQVMSVNTIDAFDEGFQLVLLCSVDAIDVPEMPGRIIQLFDNEGTTWGLDEYGAVWSLNERHPLEKQASSWRPKRIV